MVLWGMIVSGLPTAGKRVHCVNGSGLEWSTVVGESPVRESMMVFFDCVPE